MKNVSSYYAEDIPIVKLYLEDIEELFDLFSDNFDEIKIILDDYEIDNLSEIKAIKKEMTTNLAISGYEKGLFPKLRISIKKNYSFLEIDNKDDIKCLGIRNKIFEILNNRLNFFRFLKGKLVYLSALVGLFSFIVLFIKVNKEDIFPTSILCGFMFFILSTILDKIIYNKIYLTYNINSPNFFKRNKDMLIISITSAIIGTVVGTLFGYFLTRQNAPHP